MEIKLTKVKNSPVFVLDDTSALWSRVYGATEDKAKGRWMFPAFPPFLHNVLEDLENVYSAITFDSDSQAWIDECSTIDWWNEYTKTLELPVVSYEHQLEALADLLHNYRWILNYEMGTGKTKVAVDAITQLRCKTLVLCPLIAIDNWVEEAEFHSGGFLNVRALKGDRKTKINKIRKAIEDNIDVLVVTYDTPRTMGYPHISDKVRAYCKNNRLSLHGGLLGPLKSLNNPKLQMELVVAWHKKGMKPAEIRNRIEQEVQGNPQWLVDFPYTTIVADESHRIKRYQSQRTKACLELSKQAARRYLLTGTLSHGNPWDLYPQLKFLAPYLMPEDVLKFTDMYICTSPYNKHVVTGYKNLHILNDRVSRVSSVRKLADCVQLPDRRFEVVKFDLSPAQKKGYNDIVNTWHIERPDKEALEIQNGAIRLSKLLQVCSGFVYVPEGEEICDACSKVRTCAQEKIIPGTGRCIHKEMFSSTRTALKYSDNPKLKCLDDLLTDVLNSGKAIVWASMVEELDDIERLLKKNKIGYVRVDGTNTHNSKKMEKEFENNDSCMVYLAQISTGIAITLNAAKYAVYYSRDWSPEHRNQSLARNYRIGQDKKTVVYDLCARYTVELQQLDALESKDKTAALLTDRINCTICRYYAKCQKDNVMPWSPDCVLDTKVERLVAKARKI